MTTHIRRMAGASIAVTAALLVTVGASVLLAQGPGRGPRGMGPGGPGGFGPGVGPGPGFMPGLALAKLDLTEAQRTQVQTLMAAHREQARGAAERARTLHQGLREAMTAASVDESAIRARVAEVAAVQADQAVAAARLRAEIVQILTDEQRQKLAELEAARPEHGPGRGGPRGPRSR